MGRSKPEHPAYIRPVDGESEVSPIWDFPDDAIYQFVMACTGPAIGPGRVLRVAWRARSIADANRTFTEWLQAPFRELDRNLSYEMEATGFKFAPAATITEWITLPCGRPGDIPQENPPAAPQRS